MAIRQNSVDSIEFGNDFLYDFVCSLCEKEGKYVEAFRFCRECGIYICEHCTKKHSITYTTHLLLDDTHFSQEEQPSKMCDKHPGGLIKMFCEIHITFCCTLCKVLDHSDCDRWLHPREAVKKYTSEIESFVNDIGDLVTNRKADLSRIEGDMQAAAQSVADFRKKIDDYFVNLEVKCLNELDLKRNAVRSNCDFDITYLESIREKARDILQQLKSSTRGNPVEVFTQVRESKRLVNDSKAKVLNISRQINKEFVHFWANSDVEKYLKSMNTLGTFSEMKCPASLGGQMISFNPDDAAPKTIMTMASDDGSFKSQRTGNTSFGLDSKKSAYKTDAEADDNTVTILFDRVEAPDTNISEVLNSETVIKNASQAPEHVYDELPPPRSVWHENALNCGLPAHVHNSSPGSSLVSQQSSSATAKTGYELLSERLFSVKERGDKKCCNIYDICQLPDGRIVLTDGGNEKLKLFNQSHKRQDSIQLHGDPYSVCVAGPKQVAVSLRLKKKIQFVLVEKKFSLGKAFTVGNFCRGMAYVSGNLNVCVGDTESKSSGQIEVYNNHGELLHKIPNSPEMLTSPIKYMTPCETGLSCLVSMYKCDDIVMMDMAGNITTTFGNDFLKQPEGICHGDKGQVFVCGFHSNTVVQLSPKHGMVVELLNEDCGIEKPIAVHYDKTEKQLFVSCYKSNIVLIFTLK